MFLVIKTKLYLCIQPHYIFLKFFIYRLFCYVVILFQEKVLEEKNPTKFLQEGFLLLSNGFPLVIAFSLTLWLFALSHIHFHSQ